MSDDMDMRLNRIETKLDKLSDAMTTMARIDERMVHNQEAHQRMWKSVEKLAARVDLLEKDVGSNSFITRRVERFAWAIVTAIIAVTTMYFKGLL